LTSKRTDPETVLYGSIKRFLERRGYVVKGEIGACDVVAVRDGEPPIVVIAELKLAFTLELLLQATDRIRAADAVFLAVLASHKGRDRDRRVHRLCRSLGVGLLSVDLGRAAQVRVIAEPAPYRPRPDLHRRARLLHEHEQRVGDPMSGGSNGVPVMTAYRQQALACAAALRDGPLPMRQLRAVAPGAARILQRNVYGWFARQARGVYRLTEAGEAALGRWPVAPANLETPTLRFHLHDAPTAST